MEQYLKILKVNLKLLRSYLFIAVLFLCISPIIFGLSNLDAVSSAQILEKYIALIGIVLLVPIFQPEENIAIKDVIVSKYISIIKIYLIRILESLVITSFLIFLFIMCMRINFCDFYAPLYFAGTLAEAVFLGALGMFFYSISDQIVIGYMVPFLYYILCSFGGNRYLGYLYLFSMMQGSYIEKCILCILGVVFIILSIIYKYVKK